MSPNPGKHLVRVHHDRQRILVGAVAVLAVMALSMAVAASHHFTDVPIGNIFHDDITWLADNDITRGCNPPTNTLFCPEDNVTREQMAAFMHRLAQAFGATQATGSNQIPVPEASTVEVLALDVSPNHVAQVVLNAHVVITKASGSSGDYRVFLRRGTCVGEVIAAASWEAGQTTLEEATISVTGLDEVAGPTTYKLCVGSVPFNPSATAWNRSVTATWSPTG